MCTRQLDTAKSTASTVLGHDDQHAPPLVAGAASSGLRGWRLSMEDAVVHELLSPQLGVFAVLDGHGGPYCSQWGAEELPQRLRHLAASLETTEEGDEAWYIAQKLSEVVRQMDADLRSCGRPAWACGTTLVSLLVTRRSLTVANVGDSRAVLCRSGIALPLSRDHKPKVSAERERILHAGGFIVDGRVNGDLSLSRALGDFRHKCVANLPPSKQPVSAEPDVRSTKRLRSDHFLLLACDGVWDVMSSADAVALVASYLERVDPTAAAAPTADSGPSVAAGSASVAAATEHHPDHHNHRHRQCSTRQTPPAPPGIAAGVEPPEAPPPGAPAAHAARAGAAESVEALRVALGLICERLLDECIARGSTDNVSAVLVLLDGRLQPKRSLLLAPPCLRRAADAGAPLATRALARAYSGDGADEEGEGEGEEDDGDGDGTPRPGQSATAAEVALVIGGEVSHALSSCEATTTEPPRWPAWQHQHPPTVPAPMAPAGSGSQQTRPPPPSLQPPQPGRRAAAGSLVQKALRSSSGHARSGASPPPPPPPPLASATANATAAKASPPPRGSLHAAAAGGGWDRDKARPRSLEKLCASGRLGPGGYGSGTERTRGSTGTGGATAGAIGAGGSAPYQALLSSMAALRGVGGGGGGGGGVSGGSAALPLVPIAAGRGVRRALMLAGLLVACLALVGTQLLQAPTAVTSAVAPGGGMQKHELRSLPSQLLLHGSSFHTHIAQAQGQLARPVAAAAPTAAMAGTTAAGAPPHHEQRPRQPQQKQQQQISRSPQSPQPHVRSATVQEASAIGASAQRPSSHARGDGPPAARASAPAQDPAGKGDTAPVNGQVEPPTPAEAGGRRQQQQQQQQQQQRRRGRRQSLPESQVREEEQPHEQRARQRRPMGRGRANKPPQM